MNFSKKLHRKYLLLGDWFPPLPGIVSNPVISRHTPTSYQESMLLVAFRTEGEDRTGLAQVGRNEEVVQWPL
jgi:hypothetical protein